MPRGREQRQDLRAAESVDFQLPAKFAGLFSKHRYICYWGGRGSGKSVSIARALIARAHTEKLLILCTRQYQNSILDSVHRVLVSEIHSLGLQKWFEIQKATIYCPSSGSQFIFKGLQNNISEIKSLHGVNLVWVEEAQSVTEESYLILDPTLRNNSQMFISFNPDQEDDATYKRFVLNPPPNCITEKVNWRDNPWFPPELETLRQYMLNDDDYEWVWEGECRANAEAQVYRNKIEVCTFDEPPEKTRFYHGLDFGYSIDPTCLIRAWIAPSKDGIKGGEDLYIDREAYAHHLEIDEMADFFDRHVETARFWPIKADAARPETISYLCRQGLSVTAAEKWQGSVEDGIAHCRGFRKIYIHERLCPNTARDFRLYKYKIDKRTAEILPTLEEKHDHAPDALRYSLDGLIQHRGGLGMWMRLIDRQP
jgi:phage terminase large subunit